METTGSRPAGSRSERLRALRLRSTRRGRLLRALVDLSAAGPSGGDLEAELQRLAERLAAVASLPRVVVFLVDGASGELWPAAAAGVTADQLQALRQDPESPQVVRSRLRAAPVGRRTLQDASSETLVVPLRDADGGWTGMIAADVGELEPDQLVAAAAELIADRCEAQVVRAQLDEVLSRLALVDMETGLINRQGLEDALQRELVRAERNGRPCAVLALRIDPVRAMGGDALAQLRQALGPKLAATLRERLRRGDLPARLDDTTFAALLPETVEAAARVVVDDLRGRLRQLLDSEPDPTQLTVSIGLSCSSGRGSTAAGLLERATTALPAPPPPAAPRLPYA